MMAGVQLLHTLPGHVGVNLSRRQVAMPQQHLHDAQIGAVIQQMGCERMPQRVR